jgi:cation diffusion facilitator CzcD-associated flavoprotein CzcO
MKNVDLVSLTAPDAVFETWMAKLKSAVEQRNAEALARIFASDGYWRDLLSLTWEFRTFSGPREIRDAFAVTAEMSGITNIRVASGRSAPKHVKRSGRHVIEGYFDFDTAIGWGAGFVRIQHDDADPENPKAWQLLTTLHQLRGFEEKVGANRPTGEKYSKIESPVNWKQEREIEKSFVDRDPEVVIVGAGQGGLMLAARLRQMGVDALVIEQTERVGDVWRNRYNNLTLHNEVFANHFPYMPFPSNWPVWVPKDMLADWLEAYAKFQELNVWTGTQLVSGTFDEESRDWVVDVQRNDGTARTMRPKHLVAAMGISGGVAKKPRLPGLSEFSGAVVHSGEFRTGMDWVGKRAIVVGTGNSGHDIAQDLYVSGATKVSIMQRGPTCVVSLEPSAAISYSVYAEGRSIEDADLMVASIPYPVLIDTYQWITKKTTALDRDLLTRLNAAGFKTHLGEDETGFQLLYLRGAGGYYINVGCSELIIERKIPVLQAEDMDCFVAEGLRMKDGSIVPCDLVVLATGFETMQEGIRRMLGDEIADRVGPIWGFDDNQNLRNMWCRTAQEGFWVMGGAIVEARLFSRFLALQIKASLEGIMPEQNALPLAKNSGLVRTAA